MFTPAQLKLVIDSIVWAFRHTERNVAETGLSLLQVWLQNRLLRSSLMYTDTLLLLSLLATLLPQLNGLLSVMQLYTPSACTRGLLKLPSPCMYTQEA
jgi:hypothetical protein